LISVVDMGSLVPPPPYGEAVVVGPVEDDAGSIEIRCSHGFESCKSYVARYCAISGRSAASSILVTWEKGSSVDKLALDLDRRELCLRKVNSYLESSDWMSLIVEYSEGLRELEMMLNRAVDTPGMWCRRLSGYY
jgi:hypothetical protein